MPATLSVIPWPGAAVAAGAPAPELRPAQAAQVVVPSAICAPHMLQNAIRCLRVYGTGDAQNRREIPLPSGVRGNVSKTGSQKQLPNWAMLGLCGPRILLSQIAEQGQTKSRPLKRLYHKNDPAK